VIGLVTVGSLAFLVLVAILLLARDDNRHDRATRAAIARIHQPPPLVRSRW
jgi:Ni/Fe-hydrogenase subunit HybB-like protein